MSPDRNGVTETDVGGNYFADILAVQAAIRRQVLLIVSTPYVDHYFLVRKIQRGLIQTVMHVPSRGSVPKRNRAVRLRAKTDYETLVASSGHAVYFCHDLTKWTQCETKLPSKWDTTIKWVSTPCTPESYSVIDQSN